MRPGWTRTAEPLVLATGSPLATAVTGSSPLPPAPPLPLSPPPPPPEVEEEIIDAPAAPPPPPVVLEATEKVDRPPADALELRIVALLSTRVWAEADEGMPSSSRS